MLLRNNSYCSLSQMSAVWYGKHPSRLGHQHLKLLNVITSSGFSRFNPWGSMGMVYVPTGMVDFYDKWYIGKYTSHGNPSWMIVNLPLFTRSSSFLTYHLGITKRIQKGHLKPVLSWTRTPSLGVFVNFQTIFEAFCRGTLQWNPQTSGHCGRSILACIQELQKAFLGDGSNRHWITSLSLWSDTPMTKTSTEPIQPWFEEQRSGLVDFLTIFVEAYN